MSNGLIGASIGAVFAAILGITVLGGSWYTVNSGYVGVVTRTGAVVGTAEPGLGFKMPLIDSVTDISIQSQARTYNDVAAYSRDQQTAVLNVSVSYRLPADQVKIIYAEYGGEEGLMNRVLDRQVFNTVKVVFGKYNAVTAIQDRGMLVLNMQEALQQAVQGPIIIESVQIENIDFDAK